jgi:tetratricopeptide (TPR) repeat protein
MRIVLAFTLMAGMLLAAPCLLRATGNELVAEGVQYSDEQALSIAGKQYEIAKLLIKQGRFDRVLPEMRKILDLNLPGEYEQAVAKSSSLIANLLVENRQYALAHGLIDETFAKMQQPKNAASLLNIKAYIFKSEGKAGKAIETLKRAIEIEEQR